MYLIESSRLYRRAKVRKFLDVSGTDSVSIFSVHLKMGADSVPEMSENFHTLTRLSVREDFIVFDIVCTVHRNQLYRMAQKERMFFK